MAKVELKPILEEEKIKNAVTIDIAALCMEFTKLDKICDHQMIDLDPIYISVPRFKAIYYPQGETFGINKKVVLKEDMIPYISFQHEYRSVKGEKFVLLEFILRSIENTLNISRNCFTSDTLIELNNEIGVLKTLCDIPCCSVLASLPWSTLEETIKTYKSIHSSNENTKKNKKDQDLDLEFHCRISIYFKSSSLQDPIVVRFHYILVE
jgi:hypothetical protein